MSQVGFITPSNMRRPEVGDVIALIGANAVSDNIIIGKATIKSVLYGAINTRNINTVIDIESVVNISGSDIFCYSKYSTTLYFRSHMKRNITLDDSYQWTVHISDLTFDKAP